MQVLPPKYGGTGRWVPIEEAVQAMSAAGKGVHSNENDVTVVASGGEAVEVAAQ